MWFITLSQLSQSEYKTLHFFGFQDNNNENPPMHVIEDVVRIYPQLGVEFVISCTNIFLLISISYPYVFVLIPL